MWVPSTPACWVRTASFGALGQLNARHDDSSRYGGKTTELRRL